MAYAAKYKIEYKRVSNNTTTIIIYQDGYTGSTITELVPDENPLEISFEEMLMTYLNQPKVVVQILK